MPLFDGRRANFANESPHQWNVVIQHSHKAARFISSGINGQNVELRFSGSFAPHPQARRATFSVRRSAPDTSREAFDQDNCR
jgi:hypothetical protein